MSRVHAVPYLKPKAEAILSQWVVPGLRSDRSLHGFSYAGRVGATWTGTMIVEELLEAAELHSRSVLRVTLCCVSWPSGLVTQLAQETLSIDDGEVTVELGGDILGAEIGTSVGFYATVSLSSSPPSTARRPLSASKPGQVLWEDKIEIDVRGDAPGMSVQAVDFSEAGLQVGTNTPWLLECRLTDLELPAAAAIVLLVNSRNPKIVAALENRIVGGAASALVADAIADVECQLVRRAVGLEDLDESGEYPVGSIGRALLWLVGRTGFDLARLRNLCRDKPDRFEAILLDTCRRRVIEKRI